ncbi:MAG: hypothetical protein ACOCRV_02080, partial [bacterium]
MTEALLNNVFQTTNQDFTQKKRNKAPNKSGKSFSETMKEINNRSQQTQKNTNKSSKVIKEQASTMDDQEFLKKLKKILAKNNREVPSELLSLLQGGSLSKQQEAMLGQLMLNLKNSKLDISELKSLLERNSEDLSAEDPERDKNSEVLELFVDKEDNPKLEIQSLNTEDLEKIASKLEAGELKLTEEDSVKLKNEIDQLTEAILKLENNDESSEQSLEQILDTDKLDNKLAELISLIEDNDFQVEDLAVMSEQEEIKIPLLSKLMNMDASDFTEFSQALNLENDDSLFAEIAAQMQEMLEQDNSKMNIQEPEAEIDLSNSDIFTLNSDSVLDLSFGEELENKNQNNFFDLDNSSLLFNFDQENQKSANNLNLENFSLNSENKTNLAENVDLRSQVVEQFRGEY